MKYSLYKKGTAAVIIASQLALGGFNASQLALGGFNAMAASPEFSRSPEEWAMLRDNKLEWKEIDQLIDEYNATVITNRHNYSRDERKLMDAMEMKDYLNDQADDYESMAAAAESTNAVLAAQLRAQANSAREQADENVTDAEIIRLGYDQIEAGIVLNTRLMMVDYYEQLDKKELLTARLAFLERQYKSAENKFNLGMATRMDVLNAREALDNGRAELIVMDAAIEQSYKNLIVLCGWKYDSTAELGELPEPDMEMPGRINYEADLETALSNSYKLRIDRKKLDNAREFTVDTAVIEKNEKQLRDDTDSVKLQVRSGYDALNSAFSEYNNAIAAAELQQGQLKKAETELALGSISQMDYLKQQQDALEKEAAAKTAKRNLLKAEIKYEAALAGTGLMNEN